MRPRKLVLLVDRDDVRRGCRRMLLETQALLAVVPCERAEDALLLLRRGLKADLVVAQECLEGASGNDLLARLAMDWPLVNRVLVDEHREVVPPDCWAHRFVGKKAGARDLLDACRTLAMRKRGLHKGADRREVTA